MDKNNMKGNSSSSDWCWTNERHVRFLNSIEASFVRAMFENQPPPPPPPPLRLDRHLPDCFESTQDLDKQRRRRHSISTADVADDSFARTDKKYKRISSQDQVVPQIENRIDDDGIQTGKERDQLRRPT